MCHLKKVNPNWKNTWADTVFKLGKFNDIYLNVYVKSSKWSAPVWKISFQGHKGQISLKMDKICHRQNFYPHWQKTWAVTVFKLGKMNDVYLHFNFKSSKWSAPVWIMSFQGHKGQIFSNIDKMSTKRKLTPIDRTLELLQFLKLASSLTYT